MYIGRFAPSPTGPLHFGSLVAAVASYLDAKANDGKWRLRIEDLDKPREVAGASKDILNTLASYGFEWDESILYQSQRNRFYQAALDKLSHNDLIYPCTCSRKEITDRSSQFGIEGIIYPKTCLQVPIKPNTLAALRIKTNSENISFNDGVQHQQIQNLANDIGDFVLKRADGQFAYQLAVVVDDAAQNITNVVRGADLLQSTVRQIFLQQSLNLTTPLYTHIPIVKNEKGEKLSKQTRATPISTKEIIPNLYQAFKFLDLKPPQAILSASISESWQWAFKQWRAYHVG